LITGRSSSAAEECEPTGGHGETPDCWREIGSWPLSLRWIIERVIEEIETVTLWRPTGPEELALVEASGWREWPPRLPGQPIFYPVLNE
jgi:hypothetical protein